MKTILIAILFILSINLSAQWSQVSSINSHDITEHNGTLYLAAANGVYKSSSITNWILIDNGLTTSSNIKEAYEILAEDDALYVATTDGIFKSIDDGTNWVKKSNGITIGGGASYEFTKSINRINGILYTGSYTGIYRSSDNGENWSPTNISNNNVVNFITHNNAIYAARSTSNQPYGYTSEDDGFTWTALNISQAINSVMNLPVPTNSFFSENDELWIATTHGAWLSIDNGLNWEAKNVGLNSDPYNGNIIRVNDVLLTGDNATVSRSFDNGLNWEFFGENLPYAFSDYVKIITFNDKLVTISSGGIWQRDISQVLSVSNSNINSFYFINYPNPSLNSTTISLNLPKRSGIEINIYNLQGQKISTLINKHLNAGIHDFRWNRINNEGDYLGSGIYFCELSINNKKVKTLKCILE